MRREAEFVAAGRGAIKQGSALGVMADKSGLAAFVPQLVRQANPQVPAAWQAPAFAIGPVFGQEAATDALAAALGTLTHVCLEQIAGQAEAWDEARLARLQPAAERWLASRGWPQAEAANGAARVVALLRTALHSEAGRWLLRAREGAAAELALSKVGAGGTAETRVVDRSFVDAGVRWIIDYKTADLGPQAGVAELAAHAERFRAQLETYALLFADEALPQQLAIFYVAHGALVKLVD